MKTIFAWSFSLLFLFAAVSTFAEEPVKVRVSDKVLTIIKKVPPTYPLAAKEKRIQGKVILDVTVNEQGKIAAVKTKESADPSLEEAAIAAIKQWEYKPILMNGKPIAVIASITINFAFDECSDKSAPAK